MMIITHGLMIVNQHYSQLYLQSQESDASIETFESKESLDEEQVLSFFKDGVDCIVCLLIIPQEKICCLEQIFLALLPSFTFHPEGFGYMITSLVDQKPHFLIIPWVEQQSFFGMGDKRKIQKSLI